MLLDGKATSLSIKNKLKEEIIELEAIYHEQPHLAIILVGENPASLTYVRNKIKACEYVGLKCSFFQLPITISSAELLAKIGLLNNDSNCHGIIVQLPLPAQINAQQVIDTINPLKDVDGFGVLSKGKLFSGIDTISAATPTGIIDLLDAYQIPIAGQNAVVVGRSNIVGKPMALLLLARNATVTIAHSKTKNLKEVTKGADILVVAIGKAKMITADMVKDGAVVVDVGINRDVDNHLCGDVDFANVCDKVSYITPVPGGVGPMTVVALIKNTIIAYKMQKEGAQC